jgi:hypothetical protein
VPSEALVQLKAVDLSGHTGFANPLNIAEIEIVQGTAGQIVIRFPSTVGHDYVLQSSQSLAPDNWTPIGPTIPGTGGVIERSIAVNGHAFFRWQRTP